MAYFNDRGILFVLSAPSGTGKSAITKRLLAADPSVFLSISVTTRAPRTHEVDTSDYRFVSEDDFDAMITQGGFLEWVKPLRGSARYGTPKAEVERNLNAGRDVLLEVDWQGLRQVVEKNVDDVVSIYILPPSLEEVERRLRERGQDAPPEILRRLAQTIDEARHWAEYDYVVINDDLNSTVERIRAIVTAERLRRCRQPKLSEFVADLAHRKNRFVD
jgi:guanylate kinase